jgi:hypothetical protein
VCVVYVYVCQRRQSKGDTQRIYAHMHIHTYTHTHTHTHMQGHSAVIDENQAICGVCHKASIFPFITPCGHLICIGCLDLPVSACTVCGANWSFGRFAAFQPSVEQANISWNDNFVATVSTKVCDYVCVRMRVCVCVCVWNDDFVAAVSTMVCDYVYKGINIYMYVFTHVCKTYLQVAHLLPRLRELGFLRRQGVNDDIKYIHVCIHTCVQNISSGGALTSTAS